MRRAGGGAEGRPAQDRSLSPSLARRGEVQVVGRSRSAGSAGNVRAGYGRMGSQDRSNDAHGYFRTRRTTAPLGCQCGQA